MITTRNKSILDNNSNLEHLHTFNKVPASMGCTFSPIEEDLLFDQIWDICPNTGIIQLRNLLPLDLVYKFAHNDGIGDIWEKHYQKFSDFIAKHNISNIFEIGGGAGRLGKLFLTKNPKGNWTMIEPNYSYSNDSTPNFKIIKKWFNQSYQIDTEYDAIIHSHVFEHMYDPLDFFQTLYDKIDENKLHIFSFPNLYSFLKKYFTNALNFEHTAFLTEEITDLMLKQIGFNVLNKEYYEDHSIFYTCKKGIPQSILYPQHIYDNNKKIFLDYINFYQTEIKKINHQMENTNGEIFLFGAHIFSQFLIYNGLNIDKIKSVLDNSNIKQNNRLYGTNLNVFSPKILKDYSNPVVILKTATYNEEIKQDILNNINSNTLFIE